MSLTHPKFTLFVVSCDSYDDCWSPFFRLLSEFWPDLNEPVVLNTERKDFQHPKFDITCSKIASKCSSARAPWSECALHGLEAVETDLLLLVLEDFFLDRPVNTSVIQQCAELMTSEGYSNIALNCRAPGGRRPSKHEILWERDQTVPYRVTTNAALWRKDALRRYLRAEENIWQFEIFGTRRAWRTPDTFFKVNEDMFAPGVNEVIHYSEHHVMRGKWARGIPAFFSQHGIEMDYSRRGFYQPIPRWKSRIETGRMLLSNPRKLITGLMGV